MKYTNTKVIGDSGEHLFAYWIIKNFNSPCRLPEIDLGIDAEIEFTDDNNNTTGEFIFAQIKSSTVNSYSHKIKLKNLYYWKSIGLPVILVGMNINDINEIYWIHINDEEILTDYINKAEEKLTNTQIDKISITINIKNKGNKLTENDKNKLATLGFVNIINNFESNIEYLESSVNSIISTYEDVDDKDKFIDIVTNSEYYEVISSYILDLDSLITNYNYVKNKQSKYNTIVDHLENYTRNDIDNLLENVNKAFDIIEKTYDIVLYFIKYKPCELKEYDSEIITQLSNYRKPIQSENAQKLVNAVNGND